MNDPKNSITIFQLMTILGCTIISMSFLTFYFITEHIKQDALIVTLVSIVIGLFFTWLFGKMLYKFPDQTITSLLNSAYTKHLGALILFLLSLYYLLLSAFTLRMNINFIKIYLLQETPIEFLILLQVIVILYGAWYGVSSIGKIAEFLFPLLTIFIVVLLIFIQGNIDYSDVLPLGTSDVNSMAKALPYSLSIYIGLGLIPFFYPFINRKRNFTKLFLITAGITSLIFFFMYILTIAAIVDELPNLPYPIIALFQHIEIEIMFLERIAIFFILIFIPILFVFNLITYFTTVLGLTYLFKLKEHTVFLILLLPLYYLLTIIPESIAETFEKLELLFFISIFVLFLFVVNYFVLKIRKVKI